PKRNRFNLPSARRTDPVSCGPKPSSQVLPNSSSLGLRLARQLFVCHRRVINERGDNRGRLAQILGWHAVKNVLVGMMGSRPVIQRVLNEFETGQTDSRK